MKYLLHKIRMTPALTSVKDNDLQELQLLLDALVEKADELGFTVNLQFNPKEK